MDSSTAEETYEKILDEYTEGVEVQDEVGDFINTVEGLAENQRTVILEALSEKGIDSVKKLEEEVLKVGPDLMNDLLTPKKKKPEKKFHTTLITPEDVSSILETYSGNPVVEMLRELGPEDQVKALTRARIKHIKQFNPGNEVLMKKLEDEIGTVLSKISTGKGRRKREILTPTGSGKNR